MNDPQSTVWYFAYGSNLDPDRFRDRIGMWLERDKAYAEDWVVRFSGDVQSEGGGGAFIEQEHGNRAWGAVYLITRDQLDAMDKVELGSERNVQGKGKRLTIPTNSDATPSAETYTVRENNSYAQPSKIYLNHILKGLQAVGWGEDVLKGVKAAAFEDPEED